AGGKRHHSGAVGVGRKVPQAPPVGIRPDAALPAEDGLQTAPDHRLILNHLDPPPVPAVNLTVKLEQFPGARKRFAQTTSPRCRPPGAAEPQPARLEQLAGLCLPLPRATTTHSP